MSDLNHNSYAKRLDISPKAFARLVGSTKVSVTKDGQEDSTEYDLGLRIERSFFALEGGARTFNENEVIEICREYSQVCPGVYSWICNGDFDCNKIPASLSIGNVIHACRTAGRLRAELLQKSKL